MILVSRGNVTIAGILFSFHHYIVIGYLASPGNSTCLKCTWWFWLTFHHHYHHQTNETDLSLPSISCICLLPRTSSPSQTQHFLTWQTYTPFKNQITAVTSYIFLLFYFIRLWVCLFLLPCVLTCHLFKYWASTATKALFQEEVNPSVKAGLQMWLVPHRTPAERLAPVAFQEMPQLFMNKWITGEGHRESV